MRLIPMEAVPNQELTLNIDGNRWLLRLKVAKSSMIADVYRNDAALLLGQRIAVGTPIIPYQYLQGAGNFILLVENEQLSDWRQFGITQQLLYVEPGRLSHDVTQKHDFTPWIYDFYSYADALTAFSSGELSNGQIITVKVDETRAGKPSIYEVYIAPDVTLSLDFVEQEYSVSSKDDALILV